MTMAAVLVALAAMLSGCTSRADSVYEKIQELAQKHELDADEQRQAVEVLSEFYDALTPKAVAVAKKAESYDDIEKWSRETEERYPDCLTLAKMLDYDNSKELRQAKHRFVKAVEQAYDESR